MEIKQTELADRIKTLEKNAEITITGGNWNDENYEAVKNALNKRENDGCNFTFRFSDELTRWDFKKGALVSSCVNAVYFPESLIETDFYNWWDFTSIEHLKNEKYTTDFYFPEFWKSTCYFQEFWKNMCDYSNCKIKRIKFYPTNKKQFQPGKYKFWFSSDRNYLEITATTKKQAIQNIIDDSDSFPFSNECCTNGDISKAFTFSGFFRNDAYDEIYFSIGKYVENDYSVEPASDYFNGIIYDRRCSARALDENNENLDYYLTFGEPVIKKKYDFENVNLECPYYIYENPQKRHSESFVLDAKEGFNLSDIHFNLGIKDFKTRGFPEHYYVLINSIYFKDELLTMETCDDFGNDCMELYRIEEKRNYKVIPENELKRLKKVIREKQK